MKSISTRGLLPALAATYTYSETEVSVNNIAPSQPDGRMTFEADAIGFSPSVFMLYQFDDRTRFALGYVGEVSTDLEGDMD